MIRQACGGIATTWITSREPWWQPFRKNVPQLKMAIRKWGAWWLTMVLGCLGILILNITEYHSNGQWNLSNMGKLVTPHEMEWDWKLRRLETTWHWEKHVFENSRASSGRRASEHFEHQWIGLRENLQETRVIFPLNMGLSCKFSLKPIHWEQDSGGGSRIRWKCTESGKGFWWNSIPEKPAKSAPEKPLAKSVPEKPAVTRFCQWWGQGLPLDVTNQTLKVDSHFWVSGQ